MSRSTCSEVETLIRNSPDTMNLVLLRTNDSRPYRPLPTTPTTPTNTTTPPSAPSVPHIIPSSQHNTPLVSTPRLPSSLTYQPVPPPRTTSQSRYQPHTPLSPHSQANHSQPPHSQTTPDPSPRPQTLPLTKDHVSSLSDPAHSSLPRSLPLRLLSDEDFDRLSAIGLPEDNLDDSQDKCVS